jgi:hypothetical protein
VPGFSFKKVHQDFYNQHYEKAINNTRDDLQEYATEVMNMDGFEGLQKKVKKQIERLTGDPGFRETVCPAAPRKGW